MRGWPGQKALCVWKCTRVVHSTPCNRLINEAARKRAGRTSARLLLCFSFPPAVPSSDSFSLLQAEVWMKKLACRCIVLVPVLLLVFAFMIVVVDASYPCCLTQEPTWVLSLYDRCLCRPCLWESTSGLRLWGRHLHEPTERLEFKLLSVRDAE